MKGHTENNKNRSFSTRFFADVSGLIRSGGPLHDDLSMSEAIRMFLGIGRLPSLPLCLCSVSD